MKGPGEEKSLDPQLWHACAGTMVQIPPLNSIVFYFPQGHLEHSKSQPPLDLTFPKSTPTINIPSLIPCRVSSINYLADPETDEVYTKIALSPLPTNNPNSTLDLNFFNQFVELEEKGMLGRGDNVEKPASFAKTLTQSDANNGGGFSVPRYCAETIFPRLDYTADPPVQTVVAKDVHGEVWKFRHIYRGTPRRHLLTTGWSAFVNQKKLVAGDSIVFLRSDNGELRVGIRRAVRGTIGTEWARGNGGCLNPFGGFWKEEESKRNLGLRGKGKGVRIEEVLEAAARAANGQPFEVVYYPRASTPEFFVKAASVREAMRIRWCPGMRFKMAFETEDSSRISWFMGTAASVQVSDPIRWPNSPWRLLQVTWDEPDLLQNVKRVSPWLVELASNTPVIHMSPYSPPRKKLRLPQQFGIPLDSQFHLRSYSGNPLGPSSPLCSLTDNTPAGIQGARHAQFGLSLSDLQLYNKLQSGLFLSSLQPLKSHSRISECFTADRTNRNENLSCLLTMGNSNSNREKYDNVKKHRFLLFGQPIVTEQQISHSCTGDAVSEVLTGRNSSDKNTNGEKFSDTFQSMSHKQTSIQKSSGTGFPWHQSLCATEIGMDIGQCKVFIDSDDLGRTLDLALFSSYEELHTKLANMFGIERLDLSGHVLYRDVTGAVKLTGDEPFSVFRRTARRLTIAMNPASSNDVGRTWITGMRNAESGIEASNKAGPLSIFA